MNITLPYIEGISEKMRRVFEEYGISSSFKPFNTIRQKLVHPKDRTPKEKKSDVIYGIKCDQKNCQEVYIGETAQPLTKRMYQHRCPSSSGNDSAVYSHLEESGHSFSTREVKILDRESRWYERGVKEAIYERSECPSLNRRGGCTTTCHAHGIGR